MIVGVFSDTHGRDAKNAALFAALGPVDALLHLGDFGKDLEANALRLGVPYYAVRGNGDAFASGLPSERVVSLGGARLLLTHGHSFYNTYELAERARQLGCGAALFGHTHLPHVSAMGEILLLNPGSAALPRGGKRPSCARLTIENGDIDADIVML